MTVPGVYEAGVVSRPDKAMGEVVAAFVVLTEDAAHKKAEITAAITEKCRQSLAKFKNPRAIMVVDELPKIGNNKIDRKILRDMAKNVEPAARAS
jgi:long-chain acyl-CoA synthetase